MELDLQRFYNVNRRAVMWILFFAILFLLRDFFSLVFLTFIFAFLMRKVARFAVTAIRAPYWAAVTVPYLIAVALLVLLMVTAVPRVVDEGVKFSKQVPQLFLKLAEGVEAAAPRYGMEPMLAKYREVGTHSAATAPRSGLAHRPETTTRPTDSAVLDTHILADRIQGVLLGFLPGVTGDDGTASLGDVFRNFVLDVVGSTLNFLLAILLSFLIVLDFDNITCEMQKWRESSVGGFFHEAAASLAEFSGTVGTAFQCQIAVALLNASITSVGLFLLDIQPLFLLTTIVFLCGLIPVLGVFISSVPIILIAFNDAGVSHALLALGMIVLVHLLEAYVFNPRIYAARFHLNPVIVLIILLVGEKMLGVWGMLLGIPVTHYVLNLAQMPSQPRKKRSPSAHKPAVT